MVIEWEHPARGDMPPLKLTWHDGVQRPPSPEGLDLSKWGLGVLFIGEKGKLVADYGKHILLPEDKFRGFQRPDPWFPKSLGHHQEWIHACKTGEPTTCNFQYAGWLTEANHLGNVAYRTGKKLQWDPVSLSAPNAPEVEPYIRREYRKGWRLA